MDQSDLAEFRKAMAAIRDFANADESTMVTMPNGVKVPSLRRGVDIARNKGKTKKARDASNLAESRGFDAIKPKDISTYVDGLDLDGLKELVKDLALKVMQYD